MERYMNDIKTTVAKNIALLRQNAHMTQLDLAERLNYSDKAISKWERGESTPDVSTLLEIAELFDVSLDFLVRQTHTEKELSEEVKKEPKYNRSVIVCVALVLVSFLSLLAFVLLSLLTKQITAFHYLVFLYAVPVAAIVWLVLNSIWFNKKFNYFIISLLMWSVLASVQLSLQPFGIFVQIIYLLGIPGQLVILLWSFIKNPKRKAKHNKE